MAVPTYRGASAAKAENTTSISPTIPAGTVSGELMFLFAAASNAFGANPSITAQGGGNWQAVTSARQEIGSTTTHAGVVVYYDYYNGTQTAPTLTGPGNNMVGRIITISGARAADGPAFAGTAGGSDSDGNTTFTATSGFSTTDADCLILLFAALALSATTFGATWTNANLASITNRVTDTTILGNDSSVSVVSGTLATAGAVGAFTNTLTGAVNGVWAIVAVRPPVAGISASINVATETDTALAFTAAKTETVAFAAETDAALALSAAHPPRPIAVATEADVALPLLAVKTTPINVALETDAALPFVGAKVEVVAPATETDAALALAAAKTETIALAAETDVALPLNAAVAGSGPQEISISIAVEREMALALNNQTANQGRQWFEVGHFSDGPNRRRLGPPNSKGRTWR